MSSLLANRSIRTQAELADLLAREGFAVSQATVSRDLKALGAVKTERNAYSAAGPVASTRAEEDVAHALNEYASQIAATGNIVVIRTPAAAAHVVAAVIDAAVLPGVLGTVAGDDTLLVVAHERVGGRQVAECLEQIGASA